ncbi:MAG: HD domain-containing protein [Desulfurococcaceae archaeon]
MSRSDKFSVETYKHRFSWKEISDPIYGYVYFNREVEETIIHNILIQRLRYIMQLQTAHLVYPGAVHTRFQHSLGVMHLAGLMAEDLLSKTILLYGEEQLEDYNPHSLIQATRLAGLLHDVGHACFSHAFEEAIIFERENIPKEVGNHERIGYKLVELVLLDELENIERKFDLDQLKDILMELLGETEPRENVLKLLKWIIKDSLYPADILDFLRRDSYYTGTHEYGYIDYERLFKNTYPYVEGDRVLLTLDRNTWGEFRAYMYAKANMYEHVYLHSVNRAFDLLLKEIMNELDGKIGLTDAVINVSKGDPRNYLLLTDAKIYGILLDEAFEGKGKLSILARKMLIERKPDWKRVGREYILSGYKGSEAVKNILRIMFDNSFKNEIQRTIRESLIDKLKSTGIDEKDVWIDILEISPVPRSLLIPGKKGGLKLLTLYIAKRRGNEITLDREVNLITEGLPLTIIFRAYLRRELYKLEYERSVTDIMIKTIEEELRFASKDWDLDSFLEKIAGAGEELDKKKVTM